MNYNEILDALNIERQKLTALSGVSIRLVDDAWLPPCRYQFCQPKSKKKRIRKKFAKDPANFKFKWSCYMYYGKLLMPRSLYKQFIEQGGGTAAVSDEKPKCRVCGCTYSRACPGGCFWVEDNLCSQCAGF